MPLFCFVNTCEILKLKAPFRKDTFFHFGFLIWVDVTQNIVIVFEQFIDRSYFFAGNSIFYVVVSTFTLWIAEFFINPTANDVAAM